MKGNAFLKRAYWKACDLLRVHTYFKGPDDGLMRDWSFSLDAVPAWKREEWIDVAVTGSLQFRHHSEKQHILVCAMPKSASLFFTEALSRILKCRNHQIGFNFRGGTLYYPRILAAAMSGDDTVSHCHEPAGPAIKQMIRHLHLQPVVLYRNLLDVLESRREMLVRDKACGEMLSTEGMKTFLSGTEDYQRDVIIDLFAGPYINFYESWRWWRNDDAVKPVFVKFEDLISDPDGQLFSLCESLNVYVEREHIGAVLKSIRESGGINFNKGVSGRGRTAFIASQIDRIQSLAAMHGCKDSDFLGV